MSQQNVDKVIHHGCAYTENCHTGC